MSQQFREYRLFVRLLFLGALLSASGCGGAPDTTGDDGHKHIFRAVVLHQRFLDNQQFPRTEAGIRQFVKNLKKEELDNLGIEDVENALISPRDNQGYVFNWDVASPRDMMMGKGKSGGGPVWIAHEQTGVGGKRYVAVSMGQVLLLDEEGFNRMVK